MVSGAGVGAAANLADGALQTGVALDFGLNFFVGMDELRHGKRTAQKLKNHLLQSDGFF